MLKITGLIGPKRLWALLSFAVLLVVGGCTSGGGGGLAGLGTGVLGQPCQKTEDCASGLCVRVDANGGVCTKACASDMNCPAADNWACLTSDDGTNIDLCACRKLANTEVCGDGIDNDCNAKVDDCRVCSGVAVPDDDPSNCGACGKACLPGQTCNSGKCSCPETESVCASGCTDLTRDPQNCGACGMDCGAGRTCKDGACQCSDAIKSSFCGGAGCVSLDDDSKNCGACGVVCTEAQECRSGACACPSTSAPDFCASVGCIDQKTDVQNCGSCGNQCAAGEVCSDGKCACAPGRTSCNDTCVDSQTDAANCGKCGAKCGAVQACSGGVCGCSAFGYTVCGSACLDTSSDPAHCGSCDKACAAGESCQSGKCSCASNLYCDGACVAATDARNCGVCGNACGPAQVCTGSQCQCQGFGLTACGGACVDKTNDLANCGGCGNTCPVGETCNLSSCGCQKAGDTYCAAAGACFALGTDANHCGGCNTACQATQICSSGSCKCPVPGQQYCAAQNACIDTLSDALNCGACGNKCSPTQTCSGAVCGCPTSGQVYCASAGKCVDTLSNAQACGGCDKKCPATQVCSSGSCTCPTVGQTYCSNATSCVSLSSDSGNCGACNNKCPTGTHCTSGSCQCDQAGFGLCGSTCVNPQTDKANCGYCGNACTGNYSCVSGQCKCQDPTPGPAVRLTTNAVDEFQPAAAWDGSHVGVAYRRTDGSGVDNVRFALLNANGSLVSDVALTAFTAPSTTVDGPVLAWSGSEYGVVWSQTTTYDPTLSTQIADVMFRRVGANGTAQAAAVAITPHDTTQHYGVGVAWSASYAGYAVTYAKDPIDAAMQGVFRRIGADGLTPDAENLFAMGSGQSALNALSIAAAPNGSWGVLAGPTYGNLSFARFDADGGKTLPVATIGITNILRSGGPWVVWDGTGWLKAWIGLTSYGGGQINATRGLLSGYWSTLVQNIDTASPQIYLNGASLVMVNGMLAVGYVKSVPSGLNYGFRLQRFTIPSGATDVLPPFGNTVDILSTGNIQSFNDIALVATGGSLLGIWADNRWGGTRELYAKPIDLHSCP